MNVALSLSPRFRLAYHIGATSVAFASLAGLASILPSSVHQQEEDGKLQTDVSETVKASGYRALERKHHELLARVEALEARD